MAGDLDPLVLDLVEWVAREPRAYADVLDAWRTSCPRLTVWEEANERGFVLREFVKGRGAIVRVTCEGMEFLRSRGRAATGPGCGGNPRGGVSGARRRAPGVDRAHSPVRRAARRPAGDVSFHDVAFDAGLITVNGGLRIHLSEKLQKGLLDDPVASAYFARPPFRDTILLPESADVPGMDYLNWHKLRVFDAS